MSGSKTTVLLVDDHAVVREGYRRLLEKQQDILVVAEADDGTSAYAKFKETTPDIVVLDLSMPGQGGIEVIRHLRQWDEAARILVFTMHHNVAYAIKSFGAGATGYITKSSPPTLLIDAIRTLAKGERAISPDVSHALALSRISDDASVADKLSAREFEIFRMIAEAKPTSEIAAILNLSTKTVFNYHSTIKSKLGVSSDVELVHLAMRAGLIDVNQSATAPTKQPE